MTGYFEVLDIAENENVGVVGLVGRAANRAFMQGVALCVIGRIDHGINVFMTQRIKLSCKHLAADRAATPLLTGFSTVGIFGCFPGGISMVSCGGNIYYICLFIALRTVA